MASLRALRIAACLLLLSPTAIASPAQAPLHDLKNNLKTATPFTDDFGKLVTELLNEWKVPGVSIAVVDGEDVHAQGYGFAILPDTPATPETLWNGGSTTKAFVDAALAHLISNGSHPALENGWSTPISSIIRDDFVLQDEWATDHLTLEDAASHRTGMPRHDLAWTRLRDDGTQAPNQDVVRNLRNLPLTAPPRVVAQYCNLMYITLSHIVETITGKWLKDVLKETIWEPLGMTSTYLDLQEAKDAGEHLAQGYVWDETAKEYKAIVDTVRESSGAGGIVSNVLDYSKWLKCLLHQTGPFSNITHQDIRKPRTIYVSTPSSGYDVELYGLGWGRTVLHGQVLYTHSGGTGAFGTDVYWLPDIKFAIVIFGNTAGTSNAVETLLARKLVEDKLNIPVDERLDLSEGIKKSYKDMRDNIENAVEVLYPKRPSPSLPATQNTTALVGKYFDPGYGTLDLKEEVDPQNSHSTVLVCSQPTKIMNLDVLLRRVSGDYWVLYLSSPDAPVEMGGAVAAQFKFGVDGKASGLEVIWDEAKPGLKEVRVLFNKVT